ncbi:hypothetical protein [Amycolatopsis sp. cmx-4-68]|uniref:hypothetical protein n=1 Tax=Amycolatopsis sp. cmx-4-68 TaxID=2790938 RepID=UPI00397AD961
MATVRDEADARRQLRAEHQREIQERQEPALQAAAVALPADEPVAGVLELDYTEIDAAKKALDEHHRRLSAYLESARGLGAPLADGKGPVSHWMRRSFRQRGGAEAGGVQVALESYLGELASLRQSLDVVAAAHRSNDEEAAAALRAGVPDA